jgi:hypothetical protein
VVYKGSGLFVGNGEMKGAARGVGNNEGHEAA